MQEWEADLDRYEAEYGQEKAISDEDKRAVVITEAPAALRQHLAIHSGTLSDYYAVRDVVVSYLQAKRAWVPSAAYAGSPARRDPNAMEIGQVGDGGKPNPHKGKKGSGKGDSKKGKDAKGKQTGKDKEKPGAKKDEPKRAICWKTTRATEKCWFNTKGKSKGTPKGHVQQVQQASDETASLVSAGPSASQVSASPSAATTQVKGGVRSVVEGANARLLHVAERPAHGSGLPSGILALCDQPGWHDKPGHKVYVVCGKSQQVRRKVTPGPARKVFALRSTWQFDDHLQAWKRIGYKVEWQRLADPHEHLAGGKVRAIMLFEPAPGAASVARVGDLLVGTGACASVAPTPSKQRLIHRRWKHCSPLMTVL